MYISDVERSGRPRVTRVPTGASRRRGTTKTEGQKRVESSKSKGGKCRVSNVNSDL